MHLTYNGYSHAENEVWFHVSKMAKFSPRGRREREIQRWTIMGVVLGDDEADLTNEMQALENAYSTNGGDLAFYGNNNQLTRHVLQSSGTINGTRVERFEWLPGNAGAWGSGTEYVNKRSYRIIVSAESLWSNDNLYSYQATLSAQGTCGPRKIWMPSLTAPPQQQIVQAYTTQKIVQSGMTVGLTSYIIPDSPLFPPEVEHLDQRRITKMSPMEIGVNVSLKWPVRWAYHFESPIPLVVV